MGLLLGLVAAAAFYVWVRNEHTKKLNRVYPPGPKPLPLIGNILDLTARELWLKAASWANQFGDIVYIHVFGQGLVFLNSYDVTVDLLEKRGSIYSDKPALVMAGELCGCENMVAFQRYGDKMRRQRRLMQQALNPTAIRTYQPLLEIETHTLLRSIASDPKNYLDYVRKYAGSLTLFVIYGYQVKTKDDPCLMLAEECVDILSNQIASGGGIWPVDIIPALQYLPLWFPGAGFKKKAIEWKAKMEEFVDKPYEALKQRMVHPSPPSVRDGDALACFCSTLLEEAGDKVDSQREFDIRWTANSMYSASLDTTITVVQHFILTMLQFPDMMRRAQEELDAVVGTGRLPTFTDRPSLPFIEALMSELLRWSVAVPLGLPHRLMEDDVYNGMFIPKGTLIFPNIWKMLRNPDVYPNPEQFKPERFMVEVDDATMKRRDPRNYVFGFGRRRCPGLHLIEQSLWIVMTSMIASFDIRKAKDEAGKVVEPEIMFENSVFRLPTPFACDIQLRSEQAGRVLQQTAEAS
ncbi:cytochrome P450 [Cristinia sonorae]|uniref:Cytochrome P450 n=1 Tax=Cristinia sonorae TaxID=1940300 RepID=A0A8K0UU28_9AGAR|nr:cytochrome P450 [Cristinia sonorae]